MTSLKQLQLIKLPSRYENSPFSVNLKREWAFLIIHYTNTQENKLKVSYFMRI